jgi:hypothetical protein
MIELGSFNPDDYEMPSGEVAAYIAIQGSPLTISTPPGEVLYHFPPKQDRGG